MELHEAYLLGGCLNNRAVLYDAVERLDVDCFEIFEHQEIFKILRHMLRAEMKINIEMAITFAKDQDLLPKVGGEKLMINLSLLAGSSIDHHYYIEKVYEAFARRMMKFLGNDMIKESESPDIFEYKKQLINRLEHLDKTIVHDFTSFEEISSNFDKGKSYIAYLDEYLERIASGDDCFEGFRTGYKKLDEMIGGFKNGTSTIIGARSSSGKTTFICNVMIKLLTQYPGTGIGFFSQEMTKNSIFEKILYTHAGVSFKEVKGKGVITPDEYQSLCRSAEMAESWKLYIYDEPGLKVSAFKSAIKRAIAKDNIKIFFIDYLTKLQGDSRISNKHLEIDQVSKAIQECAIKYNIPIVTLAQLNRQNVSRPDKRPIMADLRESGSIEEDADTILLMHRPKHYDTTLQNDHTEIYVAKNRHFEELGKVTFEFHRGCLSELPTIEQLAQGAMMSPQEENKQKDWESKYYAREY